METKIIILDLDNTLYSWMEAYTPSFLAQIDYLAEKTHYEKEKIMQSFKSVFKKYGSVEIPNAVFELKIWSDISMPNHQLNNILYNSQQIFLEKFEENICLFPNVKETLDWAKRNSILIFGFSDAFSFWINFRLKCLCIEEYFETIFAIDDGIINNSDIVKNAVISSNITSIPLKYTKPNVYIIDKIIKEYNANRDNIYMVGDSIEKDVLMAKKAEIQDVWAEYGTKYKRGYGGVMRSITPWTKTKQNKENIFQKNVIPTYKISSFDEIRNIITGRGEDDDVEWI